MTDGQKKGCNKQIFNWLLIGAVVFLTMYLLFGMMNPKKEGLDSTNQMLLNTIGGNYNHQQLMDTIIPANFRQMSKHDIADNDALEYLQSFHNEPMRIGKTLSFHDAMINRYTKIEEMQ